MSESASVEKEIKVGQIFYESWGYEQTNIDFVKVVGFTKSGKSAICRMMSETITSTEGLSSMAEYVVPDQEYGESFKLRVRKSACNDNPLLVGSYPYSEGDRKLGYFYPWEGRPVYQSHYA